MLVAKVLLLLFGLLTVHGGDPTQDPVYIDYGTDSPVDAPDNRFFSTDWLWDLLEESNSCDPNPCLHGGSCQQQSDAGYTCSCPEPYVGKKCQSVRNVCENATCGRGDCLINPHESPFYECKCRPPFHGPNCADLPASPCEPNPCQNGGSCIKGDRRYRCACPDGYKGRFCEVAPSDCYEGNGESYRGVVSITEEKEECLHWSSYFILQHGDKSVFTHTNLTGPEYNNNNCRNPDGDKKPWCYVKNQGKLEWNYCDIKKCSEEPVPSPTPEPGSSQFTQCGKQAPGKIVGNGIKSSPGGNPWQVSVQSRTEGSSEKFQHICGGTLLSSCWVLTAGHCIHPDIGDEYQVMLGGVNLKMEEENEETIPVIKAIRHENFGYSADYQAIHNDIALLKLKVQDGSNCAMETPFVRTACLGDQTFPAGKQCVVSGWGKTENRTISARLLKADVLLIPFERCKDKVYGNLLDNGMVCAGWENGGPDACQGDSGGPLVCQENGTYYIVGVVSWSLNGTCGQVPGVYANVNTFLSWIETKTTEN